MQDVIDIFRLSVELPGTHKITFMAQKAPNPPDEDCKRCENIHKPSMTPPGIAHTNEHT